MSRVLTAPTLDVRPHRLAAAPPDAHDPVVRARVEEATAAAYERGRAVGHREGIAAAADHVDQLTRAVGGAFIDAARAATAARDDQTAEVLALAMDIAAAVLGREPHDGGAAVAAAIRDVLDQLTDPAPTVLVHPGDRDVVADALAGCGVTVVPDPGLQAGEARVRGGWAEVDLTRAAAWAALREALDVA